MATLAIEGHKTRHNEIIQIFEMLGGVNKYFTACTRSNYFYFIDIYKGIQVIKEDQIDYALFDTYTLEDFLEKYPYKVGDYARLSRSNIAVIIKAMKWENNEVVYRLSCDDSWWSVDNLKPYKEETMGEKGDKTLAPNLIGEDYSDKKFSYKIPNGYEFDCIKNNEIILKPKQPQYPKTYKECCEILGCKADQFYTDFSHNGLDVEISEYEYKIDDLLQYFRKLIYCRSAYWKIAGEQMGLGKPWEPDWSTKNEIKYVIAVFLNNVRKNSQYYFNTILAFPTKEMRDIFYENFKNLIETCKNLL